MLGSLLAETLLKNRIRATATVVMIDDGDHILGIVCGLKVVNARMGAGNGTKEHFII